jgi:hypothetical protein
MIEETLCPICRSRMKPAKSQHGAYWRCSRWGCTGTRDVMGLSKEDKEQSSEDENETNYKPRWRE